MRVWTCIRGERLLGIFWSEEDAKAEAERDNYDVEIDWHNMAGETGFGITRFRGQGDSTGTYRVELTDVQGTAHCKTVNQVLDRYNAAVGHG